MLTCQLGDKTNERATAKHDQNRIFSILRRRKLSLENWADTGVIPKKSWFKVTSLRASIRSRLSKTLKISLTMISCWEIRVIKLFPVAWMEGRPRNKGNLTLSVFCRRPSNVNSFVKIYNFLLYSLNNWH